MNKITDAVCNPRELTSKWTLRDNGDGSLSLSGRGHGTWRYEHSTGTGTDSEFIYAFLADLSAAGLQALQGGVGSPVSVSTAMESMGNRKLHQLQGDGYIVNGVAILNPETGRRGLVDYLGYVGWVAEPSPAVQGDARAQFEAWVRADEYSLRRGFGPNNDYESTVVRRMWGAWQAALAASRPEPLDRDDIGDLIEGMSVSVDVDGLFGTDGRRLFGTVTEAMHDDGRHGLILLVQDAEPNWAAARQPVTMDDALAAGDGTMHGAIEHWQERALRAEAELTARQTFGQEPVAWMTHHDEPMLFPTAAEAAAYCEDDEQPVPLFRSPAQAVDLGQFRQPVQDWLDDAQASMEEHGDYDGVFGYAIEEGTRLLALIDSQAVGK